MATDMQTFDPEKLKAFVEHVFGILSGALISAMIYLGDKLGLYQALQQGGPMNSEELARATTLNERWVREWLRGQAGAHLIDHREDGRFALSPEAAAVLAQETSPAFAAGAFCALPQQFAVLERLPEAFKSGIGLPYDAFGREGAIGIERFLAPWFRTFLVPQVLPRLDGVIDKLTAGAKVADVGCGAGVALLQMAQAYPRSTFHGFDISRHAVERARTNMVAAGVANVMFHDDDIDPLPADGSFDFITTFDCLHDMTHPTEVTQAIGRALKPDGTWLIVDINAKPTFEENLERNPMVAMMYGFSVLSCMSSALSRPGGAGLGTLGFTEPLARTMTAAAGFTRFTRHDFDNPINAFYEVRR